MVTKNDNKIKIITFRVTELEYSNLEKKSFLQNRSIGNFCYNEIVTKNAGVQDDIQSK